MPFRVGCEASNLAMSSVDHCTGAWQLERDRTLKNLAEQLFSRMYTAIQDSYRHCRPCVDPTGCLGLVDFTKALKRRVLAKCSMLHRDVPL